VVNCKRYKSKQKDTIAYRALKYFVCSNGNSVSSRFFFFPILFRFPLKKTHEKTKETFGFLFLSAFGSEHFGSVGVYSLLSLSPTHRWKEKPHPLSSGGGAADATGHSRFQPGLN
jgi:hypothetical protein